MAGELKVIQQKKFTADCECPLEVRYVLQRNDQPLEPETQFEPTDDAVYKIVVTNRGHGYAKDVKAFAWLTASPPTQIPNNLRIIPHGLLGRFTLALPSPGGPAKFPESLSPIKSDLDLEEFRKNATENKVPFPPVSDELNYRCNVIRFGDISAGQTKVACLTIISEGARESTKYRVNLFFKVDCCRLVQVPVPVCRQVEFGMIDGEVVQED